MPTYTVIIEAASNNGTIWQQLAPAEQFEAEEGEPPYFVAEFVASDQNLTDDPSGWRVRVWTVPDADTNSTPDAEWIAGLDNVDELLERLQSAAKELDRLKAAVKRRDDLVHCLIAGDVSRSAIADAAGLTEDQLYQIWDGRR